MGLIAQLDRELVPALRERLALSRMDLLDLA